jgi:hypothetical protein
MKRGKREKGTMWEKRGERRKANRNFKLSGKNKWKNIKIKAKRAN